MKLGLACGLTAAGLLAGGSVASAATAWPTYHADATRSGIDSSEPSLDPLRPAWSAPLDGAQVFAQPVVADGRAFVVTEEDDVYALDAHDGHVLWQANVGAPLRGVSAAVGCGDIDPLGITSTPVVDPATSTLYVVGEVSTGGGLPVHHQLVGFDLYTGARTVSLSADPTVPAGEDVKQIQQRAALALANGRVYVSYGGFAGDCGTYHGWVVGVDETGSRPSVQFDVTPASTGGAIWDSGAGPSVDSAGDLYVTTGNPNSGGPAPYAEAVVKLSPDLQPLASFQDSSATGDADLGTGDALLLPDGNLFTVGKTDIGYLLAQSDLHQVHPISGTICGSDPDGAATFDAATNSVYVPCSAGGIQQVSLSTYSVGWKAGSVNGSPDLVDGKLWAAGYDGGQLQQLEPSTGAVDQTVAIGRSVPNFTSPSVADGLLLVGTKAGVTAFDGPSGPPAPAPAPPASPPPTTGYRLLASDGGVFTYGTASFAGSLGGVHLVAPVVGGTPTPDGDGYWMVASDGGVFSFGDARFFGSTGGVRLAQPIVALAATPDGRGYWLIGRDGGVFSFGDARFFGSTGDVHLTRPVVGAAAAADGGGYWLVASDGGVFSFGDARFFGSTGGVRLSQPVVGMAAVPGQGYLLVARDGGVFTFGPSARFLGSTGGVALTQPIVGIAVDPSTGGYWLVASDGGVFSFGAPFEGSAGGVALTRPVVGVLGP